MTLTPELRAYRRGDIDSLPRCEQDPFEGWPAWAEMCAHDLRSIYLADRLVCSFGYYPMPDNQALAFAVVDRVASTGHGSEVASLIRGQQSEWMNHLGVDEVLADCVSTDRAAAVFLRAIGFKRCNGDDPTRSYFKIIRG